MASMGTVKIFPSGPSWDGWDKHRGQAAAVDSGRLESAYPPASWTMVDELADWPGEGWTVLESDVPGFIGNMVIAVPYSVVRSKMGIGQAAAAIGAGTIAGVVGLAVVGWLLLGRK